MEGGTLLYKTKLQSEATLVTAVASQLFHPRLKTGDRQWFQIHSGQLKTKNEMKSIFAGRQPPLTARIRTASGWRCVDAGTSLPSSGPQVPSCDKSSFTSRSPSWAHLLAGKRKKG